jgi:diguanylate cyclase (GGDEF)-like protein
LVGRYGGEEFVIFLPGSTKEDATRSCGRILELFRRKDVANHEAQCAFSAGVAEVDAGSTNRLDDYVSRADAAMYEAKRAGKGRVNLWRDAGQGEGEQQA